MNYFERVGIALIRRMESCCGAQVPSEPEFLYQYGIYRYVGSPNHQTTTGKEYLKYEGYKHAGWLVGLPLAGPNAADSQPMIELHPKNPDIQKTYFK